MAVITISRGSYGRGREVAQKVAQKLGYQCISREALLKTSKEFNIPEIMLIHAFEDGPSFLNRSTRGKEKYTAFIQAALLNHLKKDNVVYHGSAFHFFVKDIPRVLKVLIIAKLEDRIKFVMERDNISRKRALRFLEKIDKQRRKWSQNLYGIDPWDPVLYDLVLRIDKIKVEDAVDTIANIIQLEQFQMTPESIRVMHDLALAAEVKTLLIDAKQRIDVYVEGGFAYLKTERPFAYNLDMAKRMGEIVRVLPAIKGIQVVTEKRVNDRYSYFTEPGVKSIKDTLPTYLSEL